MSRIISNIKYDFTSLHDSFPYQYQAFDFLKDLDYGAIFHEQGLGKTKIAIDLLLYYLKEREVDTVLIVTKKQLVNNWKEEFAFHTNLKPVILSNNKAENYYVFNGTSKVVITNFETLSTEHDRFKLYLKTRDVAIIIDESAKIKNPKSKLTQSFFDLSEFFKIKIIMTGTPVANRPYDIWAQIYFLDKGKSLGTDYQSFVQETDLSNKLSEDATARKDFEDSVSSIFDKISKFSVRETKDSCGISLPKKIYQTHYCNFENHQNIMYQKIIEELQIEINKDGEKILDDDSASLKRLLRLNQVTSNPKLIDDSYTYISGKEDMLDTIISSVLSKNEKCIVWSNYIENVDYFTKKYKNNNAVKIHGKMTIDSRNKSVDSFKHDENCMILFATPQAAKEGLTLTVANHVIFYDRGFNLDDYLQAQDRIHRISQKNTCYVHNIEIRSSIDEWITLLLNAKHRAALLAQGDISKDEYSKTADYSYGDLIKEILRTGENYNG